MNYLTIFSNYNKIQYKYVRNEETLNVLYLINYAGKGGTETYIKILSEKLISGGNNVHLLYNIKDKLCVDVKKLGISPVQIKMAHPFDVWAAFKLAKYCKENKIDVIHTQHQRENYVAVLSKLFNPKVKTVFTYHFAYENSTLWKFTNKFITKWDDATIAVCEKVNHVMNRNNVSLKNSYVIYNGVPYEDVLYDASNSAIRKEFGIDENTFVFVSLTRFTSEKGNLFLLKSILELKKHAEKPFKLFLVGEGEEIELCKQFAQQNNLNENVIFAGYRTDPYEFLKASNCYVNSSSSEALSFAIIEGLAKGLPAIVTSVGGNGEIVNEQTGCGLVIDYGDINGMASAMQKLMSDESLVKKLRLLALQTVKTKFNLENTLENTINVYKQITGKGVHK